MSMCPMCAAGLRSSCLTGFCESTAITETGQSPQETPSLTYLNLLTGNIGNGGPEEEIRDEQRMAGSGRSHSKRGGSDSQSAGRKVAAKLYPLDSEKECEWQGKGNCGGGDYPILGCLEGKQQARHHGPEKNVQNNEEGNVHRICHYCHYRWHAKNDPTYDWNAGVWPAHKPRPLSQSEQSEQALDLLRYNASKTKTKIKELD